MAWTLPSFSSSGVNWGRLSSISRAFLSILSFKPTTQAPWRAQRRRFSIFILSYFIYALFSMCLWWNHWKDFINTQREKLLHRAPCRNARGFILRLARWIPSSLRRSGQKKPHGSWIPWGLRFYSVLRFPLGLVGLPPCRKGGVFRGEGRFYSLFDYRRIILFIKWKYTIYFITSSQIKEIH